jgi:DNA-binding NtrC family response regulator
VIGYADLAQQGIVRAALERTGHATRELHGVDAAVRELISGGIEALVIETVSLQGPAAVLLEHARAHSVPTLVVARERGVSAAVDTLRAGATDYLTSPFEFESLLRSLDRLIDVSTAPETRHRTPTPFVTQDSEVNSTLELLRSVAPSDATILIEGESGTGKELLAELVHASSPRRNREMVCVNCAALPSGLVESELFGHERGAFTGAVGRSIGKFELAHGTTLLLDEIGELELQPQAKLLRVIQEKQVQRVGARKPLRVDFRLVATTNRSLESSVQAGRFREDLFYRLNVVPIRLTPLRERPGDVPLLLDHFLQSHAQRGRALPHLPPQTLELLEKHSWPGNVRELENAVERMVLTLGGREVLPSDLEFVAVPDSPPKETAERPAFRTIRAMERWLIVETLTRLGGNRTQAARELGISLRTLRNKIREYEVTEPSTLPRTGTARPPHPSANGGQITPGGA